MAFQFNFTPAKLQEILPHNKEIDEWFPILEAQLDHYEVNTIQRAAAFLAQTAHESMEYTVVRENLNYKWESLRKVFPKYFPDDATAQRYAHNQEMIANRVYGGRMGNGPESSGDGYRFRGRGIVQITGHNNYLACSKYVFGDDRLLYSPDWLESKEGCVTGACWFWNTHNLNAWSDYDDIVTITKRINGGTIGLEDRKTRYNEYCDILADDS